MNESRLARLPFARFAFLASLCFLALVHAAGAQEQTPARHQDIDLAKLFDTVVDTVEQKFFDTAKLRQIDWRARASAVRPSVLSAPSTADAVRKINALLSELKTSHTALLTPDDYDYYALLDVVGVQEGRDWIDRRFWASGPYYPGTGAFTRESGGRHFVDGVLEGSPAERAGLKYGDEILSVNGMPYSPIAAFRGTIGTTVDLGIRRLAGAAAEHLEVLVVPIRPTVAFSSATLASARVIERDNNRIGYVHVWASNDSNALKLALTDLGADQAARNPLTLLIVDMRGRVGGYAAVAQQIVDALGPRQSVSWGNRIDRSGVRRPISIVPQSSQFHGRSAVLIDHHARSAAELVAYAYNRSGFGTLVGTRTAGAVSSGALFVMPGDLLLYVAIDGLEFDGGQRLEGVGVAPDRLVERPLPYAAGADPVLDAAVDLLDGPTPHGGATPISQPPETPAPTRAEAPDRDILHAPVSTVRPRRAFGR